MKFENIVKRLETAGYKIEVGQFNFQSCKVVNGVCLIDVLDGEVLPTSAKYADVVSQIEKDMSHIYNIETRGGKKKKTLSPYKKLGG